MPDPIPVVVLARLAVDRGQQGHGLGRAISHDASRCGAARRSSGRCHRDSGDRSPRYLRGCATILYRTRLRSVPYRSHDPGGHAPRSSRGARPNFRREFSPAQPLTIQAQHPPRYTCARPKHTKLVSPGQSRETPPHPNPMHKSVQFRTTTYENYGPNPKKRGPSPQAQKATKCVTMQRKARFCRSVAKVSPCHRNHKNKQLNRIGFARPKFSGNATPIRPATKITDRTQINGHRPQRPTPRLL